LLLNDIKFLDKLRNYEKDGINEETIELLEPYLKQQGEWLNLTFANKASKSAGGILNWVVNIHDYHLKSKIVKPKQAFLVVMEGKLKVAMRELEKSQEELR